VASRPLRVKELADVLAFDIEAGLTPKYRGDWRVKSPIKALLSTCSMLLFVVDLDDSQVVQFSHFSVREFLTSARFAEKYNTISHRYHISMTPAHTLLAQTCLGILLHLDRNVTRDSLSKFPLAEYAAEHWFEHARFEGVSQKADKGMKELFDRRQHHLAVWLWISDPTVPPSDRDNSANVPSPPRGTPVHYAASCGLRDVVEVLVIEHPQDVNSRSFKDQSTPLHLALRKGHVELARFLIEHGADATTRDKGGWTPLHWASGEGHVELARLLLVEHGADATAQDKGGWTPLHWASGEGYVKLARLLVEHDANPTVQDKRGRAPLHWASERNHVELSRLLLVEYRVDVAVQDMDGRTPLHLASERGHVELAQLLLVEHGADAATQDKRGRTPLHWASEKGHMELARLLLVEHGADATAQAKDGRTPLDFASERGHMGVVRLLAEHHADSTAQAIPQRTFEPALR
jgi:ankyrin repeat protein